MQSTAIAIHKKRVARVSAKTSPRYTGISAEDWAVSTPPDWATPSETPVGARTPQIISSPAQSRQPSRNNSPSRSDARPHVRRVLFSLGSRHGPGHVASPGMPHRQHNSPGVAQHGILGSPRASDEERSSTQGEELISAETAEDAERRSRVNGVAFVGLGRILDLGDEHESTRESREGTPHSSVIGAAYDAEMSGGDALNPREQHSTPLNSDISGSRVPLATETVMSERAGLPQDLTPFFTDPTGLYYKTFERKLESLNGKTSEVQLCIEEYLEKSEREWFKRLHTARMSRTAASTPSAAATPAGSIYDGIDTNEPMSQFLLPENYAAPTGLRRALMYKLGDWPLYTFLLGLGQILGATSYQITLLTGQLGQPASRLYVVASIYIASSLIWWIVFRRFACRWCLSLPWLFYGLAWCFLALAPYGSSLAARGWIQNVAIAMYAIASSSSSLFFAQ